MYRLLPLYTFEIYTMSKIMYIWSYYTINYSLPAGRYMDSYPHKLICYCRFDTVFIFNAILNKYQNVYDWRNTSVLLFVYINESNPLNSPCLLWNGSRGFKRCEANALYTCTCNYRNMRLLLDAGHLIADISHCKVTCSTHKRFVRRAYLLICICQS